MLDAWTKFLDSIDSNGGHLIFLYIVILTAAVMNHYGVPKSEDMMTFALGVMSRGMTNSTK